MNISEHSPQNNTAASMLPLTEKLYTNRLMLRKIRRKDLTTLVRWSHSSDAYGDFLSPEHYDIEQIEQKYDSGIFWNAREKLFLIERRDNLPLGTLHYWLPAGKFDVATMAVKIAEPKERNKGYGTEAQKFLLIYLFEKIKMKLVEMYTDLDNLAQQRCLKKLGFNLVETLTYDDRGIRRTGNLYRLDVSQYSKEPVFHYHYE